MEQKKTLHESRRAAAAQRYGFGVLPEFALWFSTVGAVLWLTLFTDIPALHDAFHAVRHALTFIPCH